METVQQNGRFTLFSSKFTSIYSILYGRNPKNKRIDVKGTVSKKNSFLFVNLRFCFFCYRAFQRAKTCKNPTNGSVKREQVKQFLAIYF